MNTLEKVALALVGAGMLYTAVAPRNQTAKVATALGNIWTSSLKIVTGQA